MKQRILSVLLVLCMIAALFAFTAVTAGADVTAVEPTGYKTAEDVNYVKVGSYVANWGARGEDCRFLSTYAQNYYTGNYAYSVMSKLSGGSQSTAPSSALYSALKNMMVAKKTSETSYNGTRDLYKYTDCIHSDYQHISSFYSGKEVSGQWDSGSTWNREHVWPNSKIDNNGENDICMLRPTWVQENSDRGNKAYGESGSTYYFPNMEAGGTVSNPRGGTYDVRGDCARIILFVYTRWGVTEKMWGASGVMESAEILLKWMEEDPVDTWEMGRNDACQSIVGCRNVFIDYPEYAFLLFGKQVPAGYVSPSSGVLSGDHTVTASSNNNAWGTVSVDGYVITCTPNAGYYFADCEITEGSGTTTISGNKITVKPESDCHVLVRFAPVETVTVSFKLPDGVTKADITGNAGSNCTLSAPSGTPSDTSHEYTFAGWLDRELEDTTIAPADMILPGTSYTLSDDITLYAVYSYAEKTEEGGSGDYRKVTQAPSDWSGDYVIVYEADNYLFDSALETLNAQSNYKKAASLADQTVSAKEGDPCKITVSKIAGGYSILCANGQYIGMTSSDNGLIQSASVISNTISINVNGSSDIVSANCYFRYNKQSGQTRFRYYKSTSYASQQEVYLYRKDTNSTVTHYLTIKSDGCTHANAHPEHAEPATCTEPGYTEGVWCPDCETWIEGHEEVAPLNHDYKDGFCTRCGEPDPDYVSDPCRDYLDIDRSLWYHSAIDFVIGKGLMGSTNTESLTFEPAAKVTRCMVASILYRMEGSPEAVPYTGTFSDVPQGVWFTEAIEWCAQNGLASGKGDGRFDPMGNVTRQELAVFMKKMAEHLGRDVSGKADLSGFEDADSVLSWSADYLAWAVDAGIISGQAADGKTYLNPAAGAMRCELASILMRFMPAE